MSKKVNVDPENGVAFGVIPHQDVGSAWYDSSESYYGECECPEDGCMCEVLSFYYTKEGYKAFQSAEGVDIFVEKSPYFTYARECSPCAPNACYLRDHDPHGFKCYCLGHDWFEGGRAPYPVFSMETGEEVSPNE